MTQRDIRTRKAQIALSWAFKRLAPTPVGCSPLFSERPRSVLVLAAHYDDDIIGCGGALAGHCQLGDSCRVLYMTDGSASQHPLYTGQELAALRKGEASKALSRLGEIEMTCWEEPDGQLRKYEILVNRLAELLLNHRFDYIYFPNLLDTYQDHQVVGEILLEALAQKPQPSALFMYEIVEPMEAPDVFVDISNEMKVKIQALQLHQTQLEYMDYIKLTRFIGKTRGQQAHTAFCEAFCRRSLSEFYKMQRRRQV